jgi:ribosomal protein S18 acetylase RimI-like enzyme
MSRVEARLAEDVPAGSVLLPRMLESALDAADLVGGILRQTLPGGSEVAPGDIQDPGGLRFVPFYEYLDRPGAMERLEDLDRRAFEELGLDFSDAPWTASNFRLARPGKAAISFVAEIRDEFVGYCVGSEVVPGEVHGNRLAIEPRWRTGRMALQLWCAQWRRAVANPANERMTAELGTENRRMRRFLDYLGFRPMTPAETRTYLERRGRDEPLEGAEIVDAGGARSIAMSLRLRSPA